ncbi:MAG: hypothetical protein EBU97_06765, partial [Rhodobacteraceae bacterium]|nr:hypothetical protein [Paracoccaceae bacterium]
MASDIQSLRKQLTGTLVSPVMADGAKGAGMFAPPVVPLEPRMLMDASLGWDVSGDTPVIEMLAGLHALVEHQVQHFDDFIT